MGGFRPSTVKFSIIAMESVKGVNFPQNHYALPWIVNNRIMYLKISKMKIQIDPFQSNIFIFVPVSNLIIYSRFKLLLFRIRVVHVMTALAKVNQLTLQPTFVHFSEEGAAALPEVTFFSVGINQRFIAAVILKALMTGNLGLFKETF